MQLWTTLCRNYCTESGSRMLYMLPLRRFHSAQQSSFSDQLVEQAFPADELCWRVELLHFTLIQHDNAIAVKDRVDSVGDYNVLAFSMHEAGESVLLVMIVRSLNMLLRKVVCSIASVSISTAAVASSRTRMLLGVRRARANDISCLCPWLRLEPASWISADSPPSSEAT
jgi:hypothetical protein